MTEKDSLLNYGPDRIYEALCKIFSGKDSVEKLSDDLGLSQGTVYNIVSDLKVLGIVKTNSGMLELVQEEEVSRICQINDLSPLRESFEQLSYFEALDEIEGEKSVEELGNEVSFYSSSKASSETAKKRYGAKIARWAEYLDLVSYDSDRGKVFPPDVEVDPLTGESKILRAYPKNVLALLSSIGDESKTKNDVMSDLSLSKSSVTRSITTAFIFDLIERKGREYALTEEGRKFRTKSEGRKKEFIRNKLFSLPIIKAIVYYLPENQLKVAEKVSKEYNRGWSQSYCDSIRKKHLNWLKYAEAVEKNGNYVLTEKSEKYDIERPDRL